MTQPSIILALDTSQAACSVAVVKDGVCLATRQEFLKRGHAERLLPLIDEALLSAQCVMHDITKIAVVVGPGAYTGVRVAVSVARGLALALGVPCVGVSALTVLAHQTLGSNPTIDTVYASVAGRGDTLFFEAFKITDAGLKTTEGPKQMTLTEVEKLPNVKMLLVGSGRVQMGFDAELTAAHVPKCGVLAGLVKTLNPKDNPPEPLYLRDADAVVGTPAFLYA